MTLVLVICSRCGADIRVEPPRNKLHYGDKTGKARPICAACAEKERK